MGTFDSDFFYNLAMADDNNSPLKTNSAMLTDVGMVREHNEDSVFIDNLHGLFVVADGMGGHAAGEVASQMAVEEIKKALLENREAIDSFTSNPTKEHREDVVALIESSVHTAHKMVYETGLNDPTKKGMGTTLDILVLAGTEAFVAHVGDSRTYLIRNKNAVPMTMDHTVAEVLVVEGKLTKEEAEKSPLRTVLVNAIGVASEVGVEMTHLPVRKGDKFLVCSDGLYDYFPNNSEVFDVCSQSTPEEALGIFIEGAKNRGGHDNITGVVVEIIDAPDSADFAEDVNHDVTESRSTIKISEEYEKIVSTPTLKIATDENNKIIMTDETEDMD